MCMDVCKEVVSVCVWKCVKEVVRASGCYRLAALSVHYFQDVYFVPRTGADKARS